MYVCIYVCVYMCIYIRTYVWLRVVHIRNYMSTQCGMLRAAGIIHFDRRVFVRDRRVFVRDCRVFVRVCTCVCVCLHVIACETCKYTIYVTVNFDVYTYIHVYIYS